MVFPWKTFVVKDDERAILTKDGRMLRVLAPGRHRLADPRNALAIETFRVAQAEFPAERHTVLSRSLPDAAAAHYPWLPTQKMMHTRLDSFGKIGRYHGPLLMVHGEADTIIPLGLAKRLFEHANEPKQFVLILGGDHNVADDPKYLRALDAFLSQLP